MIQVTLCNPKPASYSYFLCNSQLRIVDQAKCLQVLLDSKLNFNKDIDNICRKANNVLALLK